LKESCDSISAEAQKAAARNNNRKFIHQVLQQMYDTNYGEPAAQLAASEDDLEEFKDPLDIGDLQFELDE